MEKYQGLWPLPGGVEAYLDSAIKLLQFARNARPTEDAFISELKRSFGTTGLFAMKGYIRFLLTVGWIEAQGDMLVPTTSGEALCRSLDPLMAFKDIDRAYSGIQVALDLIAGGAGDIDGLRVALNARLGATWESTNQASFRANWLRSLGLVVRNDSGRLVLTARGQAVRSSSTSSPEAVVRPVAMAQELPTVLDGLVARLRAAASAGGNGQEFERTVAEAFRALGFEVSEIGGSGDTDMVVRARRGRAPVVLVVEAKSRSSGTVNDTDINWATLPDHRVRNKATAVVVVGPSFAMGNIQSHAEREKIRLLPVSDFARLLKEHERSPLGVDALIGYIGGSGVPTEAEWDDFLVQVRVRVETTEVVAKVFDAIWQNQSQPAAINSDALYWILGREVELSYIANAIEFFRSPVLAAVDGNEGLRTSCPPEVVATRLELLARRIREGAR